MRKKQNRYGTPFSFALAVLLVCALTITAFATDDLTTTIGVKGLTANSSGAKDWTASPGGAAWEGTTTSSDGCSPTYTATDGTLVLKNDFGETKILTFDYNLTLNGGSVTIDEVSKTSNGSVVKVLKNGESVTIKASSSTKAANTTTVTLSNIKLEGKEITLTFAAPTNGSYTVDGIAINESTPMTKQNTTTYTLVATPADNYTFAGWYVNDVLYSTEASVTEVQFLEDATIIARFAIFDDDPLYIQAKVPQGAYTKDQLVSINSFYFHDTTNKVVADGGFPGSNTAYSKTAASQTKDKIDVQYLPSLVWDSNMAISFSGTAYGDYVDGSMQESYCYARALSDVIRIYAKENCNISFNYANSMTGGSHETSNGVYYYITSASNANVANIKSGTKLTATSGSSGNIAVSKGNYLYILLEGYTKDRQFNIAGSSQKTMKFSYSASISNFSVSYNEKKDILHAGFRDNTGKALGSGTIAVNNVGQAIGTNGNMADMTFADQAAVTLAVSAAPANYVHIGWEVTPAGGSATRVYTPTYSRTLTENVTVNALFVPKTIITMGANGYSDATYTDASGTALNGQYVARNAGCTAYYTSLADAFSKTDVVVLLAGSTINGDWTIPAGKTFVIPYGMNDAGSTTPVMGWGMGADYCLVNLNGNLNVAGTLLVSAQQNQSTGATGGNPGHLVVASGKTITVSGSLYAYGPVTGAGTVETTSTAKIHETAEFSDNAPVMYVYNIYNERSSKKVFPFNTMFINSIEIPVTYQVGATLTAHVAVRYDTTTTAAVPIIAGSGAMMNHTAGTVTKYYDAAAGQFVFRFNSGSTVDTGSFSITLSVTVAGKTMDITMNSADYYIPLAAPYRFEVAGEMTINDNYKALPGMSIDVKEGGTLTIAKGKKLVLYRRNDYDYRGKHANSTEQWGYGERAYPINPQRFNGVSYPFGFSNSNMGSAKLNVDGTLIVNGGLYVTNEVQTDTANGLTLTTDGYNYLTGSGTIDMTNAATDLTSINEVMRAAGTNDLAWDTRAVVPLKGLKADATANEAAQYESLNGKTVTGSTNANGLNVWSANPCAEGHTLTETPAVTPTCTTGGNSAYWTCETCGKFFSDAEGKHEIAKDSWIQSETGHSETDDDKNHICDNENCDVAISSCKDNATATAAESATCRAEGNSAYWTCNVCGNYYSDEACTVEIKENSWVIDIDNSVHADANKDHICDYGCQVFQGTCEDADKDHSCDYSLGAEGGCDKVFGEHEDGDKNHTCDYGCSEAIGTCEDANKDHACDYGCDKVFGTCADANKDHICDYSLGAEGGCDKVFGEHEDGDKNHTCDYGCTEAIGDCSDSETDKDHVCDYGCGKVWNDCKDAEADGDHDCDVCGKENVTVCADGDNNHKCDDCDATVSTCTDEDKNHICDYAGCKATGMGACVDDDKDHYCDYGAESATGCREYHGTHADANKDHTCDYGCSTAIGTCEDADKDHYCDYGAESESGCRNSFGEHADTTGDKDHICNYCESEEILSDCTGAAAVTENDVAAKCEQDGSYDTVVYCSECGDELSRTTTTVPATGHTSVTDKAVDPTCTETGLTEGSHCSVCGEILVAQEVVDALGHDYDAVVTAPTCTAAGYTTYTCSVCDDTYVADETAALGHNYDAVVKEPTCTEGGYTTYTCTVCDDTYVADETEAKGHDYDAVITAPTCTEVGYTTYTCKASDHTYIADETAALGHNYDKGVVTTAPQCETTGIKTFTCTVCGDSYTEIVDATGHTEVADEAVAPTCTATGLTAGSHCSVCGETIVEQDVVGALGHSYDDGVVTTEPKCEETGTKTYTCETCGDSYEETLGVTGHTWNAGTCSDCGASSENKCEHNYTLQETVDPTCTAAGYTIFLCSECGGTKRETTDAATGHAPGAAADCTNNQVCTTCGEELAPALGHNYVTKVTAPTCTAVGYTTYTCSVCGDTYTANETPANGHSPAEAVRENEVAATCNTDGSYESVVYCSVCSTQISRDTIVVPAHGNHTEGTPVVENEKAATCTGSGSYDTVVYCSVCNTQMSRNTSTVAALGHTEVADAAVAATCTTAGKTAGSHCSVCGEVVTAQTVIEALGHDETTHEAKAATCTEVGWNTYVTCSRCGNSTYAEIPALGHDYAANVQAPTCTEDGHTTYTCSNCGDSYIADEVAANGHRYTEIVHAPTCTEAGYTAHNCSSCGDSYSTDEVPALGHTEVTTIERWTSDGVSYYQTVVTCETCKTELRSTTVAQEVFTDAAIPETIKEDYPTADALKDALKDGALTKHDNFFTEHKLDKKNAVTELYDVALKVQDETGNWNDVTADEFPAEGITVKMPIPEGTTLKNYTFFVAHIFTADINGYEAGDIEYPEVTELEEDGISYIVFHVNGLSPITMTYVQDCTEGHTYETNVTAPTCTEAGFTTYTCSVCGDTYTADEVEATGHDYKAVVTAPTCTEDGCTTYTCANCDDSYVADETDATGHSYIGSVTNAATCTEAGVMTYTCSCGASYTEEIAATGHVNTTTTTVDATCVEEGSVTVTCDDCGATISTEAIAATGVHNYVDGTCTGCGETQYHVVFDAMAVNYESEILAQFMMVLPDELLAEENAKLVITKNGISGPVQRVYSAAELRGMDRDSKGRHMVEIGLASPEYGRMISLEVFDGQGNALNLFNRKGKDLGTSPEVCAVDYAKAILSSSAYSQAEKDLVAALLTYGGYAQKFFNVDVDAPVYNNLTDLGLTVPDISVVTADLVAHKASQNDVQNGISVSTFDVILDSATSFKIYFSLAVGEDPSNYDFVLTYIEAGQEKKKSITPTFNESNRRFCVEIEDVAAAYWDYMYKVSITNKTTNSTYECNVSILAWIRQVIRRPTSNEQLELAKAMYLYNQAANKFFNK